MLFSLVVPIGVLSMFPHQEARFIIPALMPLVYLYGNYLFKNESDGLWTKRIKTILLYSWYIVNALFAIFYGFIHQGGIYPFTNDLHFEIKSHYGVHIHVITTHSYSIPTFLLQMDSTKKVWRDKSTGHKYSLSPQTFLYKYGSLPVNDLFYKIDEILSNAEMLLHEAKKKYRFYIVSPCSREAELRTTALDYYYFDLVEERAYYPHFCTEAAPKFPTSHDQTCIREINLLKRNESRRVDLNIFDRISCYINKFCLKIYRVSVSDKVKSKSGIH